MATSQESLTMSIPSVAQALGISTGLAYDLAKRDALPVRVIRCGRRLMVSRRALMAVVDGEGTKTDLGRGEDRA